MQSGQLNNSHNLNKALMWLSLNHNVIAWKCVDNQVVILISPTDIDYDPIIYGCAIKVQSVSNLTEEK